MAHKSRRKPHICFDMLPKTETELIGRARWAVEVNPQNAPAVVVAQVLTAMVLPEEEGPALFTRAEMALLTSKKWQTGQEVTFGFLRASAKIADYARAAFVEISRYANLKFREVAAASAIVRIADYEEGAYSYLGTDALGIPRRQQTMNLARSWADLATAIHECCHAVGMIHEHQSPAMPADLWNEDAVYRYYSGPPNNWSREMIKSNVIDRYSASQTQYTEWDRASIMLYPLEAALLKNPAYATGWNKVLSAADKAFLDRIYPGIAPPPPPPPPSTGWRIVIEGTGTKPTVTTT